MRPDGPILHSVASTRHVKLGGVDRSEVGGRTGLSRGRTAEAEVQNGRSNWKMEGRSRKGKVEVVIMRKEVGT